MTTTAPTLSNSSLVILPWGGCLMAHFIGVQIITAVAVLTAYTVGFEITWRLFLVIGLTGLLADILGHASAKRDRA